MNQSWYVRRFARVSLPASLLVARGAGSTTPAAATQSPLTRPRTTTAFGRRAESCNLSVGHGPVVIAEAEDLLPAGRGEVVG